MTVNEFHIAVRQKLQKAGSDAYDNFRPEQIDFFGNVVQDHMISQVLNRWNDKGVSISDAEARLSDIEPLIVKSYPLLVSASDDSISDPAIQWPRFDAILPADFLLLLNDRSELITDCVDFNVRGSTSIATSNTTKYIFWFEFNAQHGFRLTTNSGNTEIYSTDNFSFRPDLSDDERYEVITHFIHWARDNWVDSSSNPVEAYWERYGDLFYPNAFVIVTDDETLRDELNTTLDGKRLPIPPDAYGGINFIVDSDAPSLVTNGTFDGNADNWTLESGWAYDSGSGNIQYTPGGTTDAYQTVSLLETGSYLISVTVVQATANMSVYVRNGTTETLVFSLASPAGLPTTYVYERYLGAIGDIIIRGDGSGPIQISEVKIQRLTGRFGTVNKIIEGRTYSSTTSYNAAFPNRLVEYDRLYEGLRHPFKKPHYESPVSARHKKILSIYNDRRSITTRALIDYVRIPRRISLYLGQSTELQALSGKLVERTVGYILESIESPRVQTQPIEEFKSE